MSTRRLFVGILFIAVYIMTVREVADPDFWWHLRTGQFIVDTGAIPHRDIFSYTSAGKEWVTHEWLSEVLIFTLYRIGGTSLLILVFSAVITAAFALVYLRSAGKPYLAGFAVLLGALATAPTWGVRPQMLSLLLMSVFLLLLDRYRQSGDTRLLLPLPPLMLLWVNLHSGYALGLVVVGVYAAAAFLERLAFFRRAGVSRSVVPHSSPRALRNLVLVLALCGAAVLINPNGARMFVYPFETLTSRAMQTYIQEWFSPDFHLVEWQPLAWLLLALVAASLWARARVPLASVLLLIAFGYAALHAGRHVPLFVLVATPVLAAQLPQLVPLRESDLSPTRLQSVLNLALLGVIMIAAALRGAAVLLNQPSVERTGFPAAAADWIATYQPRGNLYNTYAWGGYLIWRLYPSYPVYIDGRADVYGDAFIENYLAVYRGEPGWERELERQGARLVLIEPGAPLAEALATAPDWVQVRSDDQSVLYLRK